LTIDENFFRNLKPVEKHNDHYVWKPGKIGAAGDDPNVKTAYEKADKKIEPLGIHGTYVAVDWDDCIGRSCLLDCTKLKNIEQKCEVCKNESCTLEGACLWLCPTIVFEWEKLGKMGKGDVPDYYRDKADPVREADCIWCMVCVIECPTQAIKVDENLVEFHKNIKI
jgi:NAD-dependent dihydropyrimidine dehydrogenase PreA subunit